MALAVREITIETEIEHQVICASDPRGDAQGHFDGARSHLLTDSARYALHRFRLMYLKTMVTARAFLAIESGDAKEPEAEAGFWQEISDGVQTLMKIFLW